MVFIPSTSTGPVDPGPVSGIVVAGPGLPDWQEFPEPVTPPSVLSRVAQTVSERTLTVAGRGTDIPLVYGRDVVGGKIYRAKVYGSKLICIVEWCEGEIDAVEQVIVGGEVFSGSSTHYLGTSGQTGDSLVQTVWGQADDLPDIAYSVLQLPSSAGLDIHAVIRGRDVYDPRTTTTVYSTNPALALADYIDTQTDWTPDWPSFEVAADYCDEIITGTIKRWEIGLTLKRGGVEDHIKTLREYANVFLYQDGDVYTAVPNAPRDTDHVLINSNGDFVKDSVRLRKIGLRDAPTQTIVNYTLPGTDGIWADEEEATDDPGEPLRISRLRMPGYFRRIHARRKAIERLNQASLEDLEIEFQTFDAGIVITPGDVFELTHPVGLTSKKFRCHDAKPAGRGLWNIVGREYDPATFSGVVVEDPSSPDTTLPSPNDVPNVTGLVLSLNAPQFQSGLYFSSITATWDDLTDYTYGHTFQVVFRQDGELVGSIMTTELEARFGPLVENLLYEVEVKAVGVFGVKSEDAATDSITPTGKDFPPTDVPNFVAFGVGGEVRMRWDAAFDNQAIWRYEIRFGAADVTWENAELVTRTDSLSHSTTDIAAGDWDFLIKAIDNAGNESDNAARVAGVEVDNSSGVFLLESADADRASSTLMVELADGRWVVDSGETWNALFPNLMNTYTDPLWSYQTPGAAEYISEELDPGAGLVSGAWQAQADVDILTGTPTQELELWNGSSWDAQGSVSVVEQGEKSRWKISGSASVFIVTPPTELRVDVVTVAEDGEETTIGGGEATSSNGGTQLTDTNATFQTDGVAVGDVVKNLTDGSKAAITGISSETVITHDALSGGSGNDWQVDDVYAIGVKITTERNYSRVKQISFTNNGSLPGIAFGEDDIELGDPTSFLVFAYDNFNEEISAEFIWRFEGV